MPLSSNTPLTIGFYLFLFIFDLHSYWGDGGDGTGKNMLGKTLMIVRQQIRDLENSKSAKAETKQEESKEEVKQVPNSMAASDEDEEDEDEEIEEEDEEEEEEAPKGTALKPYIKLI